MAASVATMSLAAIGVGAPSSISSKSAFATPVISVAPCKMVASRRGVVGVRACTSEEPRAARREMLAGLMAAGAALVSAGSAFAASGPGNDGAKKTAVQADDLLKAADDLTNNDSPPRYGGGRVEASAEEAGKVAQKAGSGAIEGLQQGTTENIEGAKKTAQKAGDRLGGLFKGDKSTGDLSTNSLEEAASNVSGGVDDLVKNGPGKISSDVKTAGDKVKNDIASSQGFGKQANSRASDVVDQAQDKASNVAADTKGFFGDLKSKITDSIPQ